MADHAPLLHLGYHKTGTTWLQEKVFLPTVTDWWLPWHRGELLDLLIMPNPFDFDASAVRSRHDDLVKGFAPTAVPVLSYERLSGAPHAGGYDSRIVADRLFEVYPDGKVLVVIRRQVDFILSWYKQYIEDGGASSLPLYLAPPGRTRGRVPQFRLDYFEYDRLIRYYQCRFGKDRVLVLPFEMLGRDPRGFVGQISDHVGIRRPEDVARGRVNRATRSSSLVMMRQLNQLFVRESVNPAPLLDLTYLAPFLKRVAGRIARDLPRRVDRAMDRRWSRQIAASVVRASYAESNRRTAELTGLDLAALGYAV